MRIYQCDSCKEIISDPYIVKMKEFYLGVDFGCLNGIAIPIESRRKVKIHLCDECYKGLNLIGGLVPKKENSKNND